MDLGGQVSGIAQLACASGKGMNEEPDEHQGNGGQHVLNWGYMNLWSVLPPSRCTRSPSRSYWL